MKTWQFYSLHSSIFIVASVAAASTTTKVVFLLLAVAYMLLQFAALKRDA